MERRTLSDVKITTEVGSRLSIVALSEVSRNVLWFAVVFV